METVGKMNPPKWENYFLNMFEATMKQNESRGDEKRFSNDLQQLKFFLAELQNTLSTFKPPA